MTDDPPSISVLLDDRQTLPVEVERLENAARRTAEAEGALGEISLILVTSDEMARMNSEFMGHDGPTDVLSFPIDGIVTAPGPLGGPPIQIGEVVLCPEVAAAQNPDLASELDLLTAHGVLHLLGFDHLDEEGASEMRRREFEAVGISGARYK